MLAAASRQSPRRNADCGASRAGKSRFSSRFFEMGLDGAARGLERLLAACRTPFYARYAAHLPGGGDD